MEPYTNPEPMSKKELDLVVRSLGFGAALCELGQTDLTRGKAKLAKGRCFWHKDGKRVTVELTGDGGHIAYASEEVDPTAPATGTYT